MHARAPTLVLAACIVAAVGCRPPIASTPTTPTTPTTPPAPAVAPSPTPEPPTTPPPPAHRFTTPLNPDIAPQPPVVTQVRGRSVRRDIGGGWRVKLEPAEITAAPGDAVELSLELRATRPGSGRPQLASAAWELLRWPDLRQRDPKDPADWLPIQGGVARGVLRVGAHKSGTPIYVTFTQRQRPGSLSHATIEGPQLHLDTTSLVPVDVRQVHAVCELPDGLAVTVDGRRVTASFARPMRSGDSVSPAGEFVVRRISGRLTLIGFVSVYFSDLSMGHRDTPCPQFAPAEGLFAPRHLGATVAEFTAPEPGPVDIVFFVENVEGDPRHATAVLVE